MPAYRSTIGPAFRRNCGSRGKIQCSYCHGLIASSCKKPPDGRATDGLGQGSSGLAESNRPAIDGSAVLGFEQQFHKRSQLQWLGPSGEKVAFRPRPSWSFTVKSPANQRRRQRFTCRAESPTCLPANSLPIPGFSWSSRTKTKSLHVLPKSSALTNSLTRLLQKSLWKDTRGGPWSTHRQPPCGFEFLAPLPPPYTKTTRGNRDVSL